MSGIRIAPSLLSADFTDLRRQIKCVEDAGADLLHVDVMDGHFVPNITFGPLIVDAIHRAARVELDVHLMIADPGGYLERFIEAGSDYVTFHVEAVDEAKALVEKTKALGIKGGVAVNPATSLDAVAQVFEIADLIVMMTVNPGFGGQEFMPNVIPKIRELYELKQSGGYTFEIEVDGGVGPETAAIIAWAGADILVAGASIFESGDPRAAIKAIAQAAQQGLTQRSDAKAFSLD